MESTDSHALITKPCDPIRAVLEGWLPANLQTIANETLTYIRLADGQKVYIFNKYVQAFYPQTEKFVEYSLSRYSDTVSLPMATYSDLPKELKLMIWRFAILDPIRPRALQLMFKRDPSVQFCFPPPRGNGIYQTAFEMYKAWRSDLICNPLINKEVYGFFRMMFKTGKSLKLFPVVRADRFEGEPWRWRFILKHESCVVHHSPRYDVYGLDRLFFTRPRLPASVDDTTQTLYMPETMSEAQSQTLSEVQNVYMGYEIFPSFSHKVREGTVTMPKLRNIYVLRLLDDFAIDQSILALHSRRRGSVASDFPWLLTLWSRRTEDYMQRNIQANPTIVKTLLENAVKIDYLDEQYGLDQFADVEFVKTWNALTEWSVSSRKRMVCTMIVGRCRKWYDNYLEVDESRLRVSEGWAFTSEESMAAALKHRSQNGVSSGDVW
ncbi:hypothetical protein GGR57DRAFT_512232 [Xylariaceae sp. FL1272]|nr:hypothetical protein GGR57DRAFT_512232 [Xylariaceae sp. FL1272]